MAKVDEPVPRCIEQRRWDGARLLMAFRTARGFAFGYAPVRARREDRIPAMLGEAFATSTLGPLYRGEAAA